MNIVITRANGTVAHMSFQTQMRAPSAPEAGGWSAKPNEQGFYTRAPLPANIDYEIGRMAVEPSAEVVSWRGISDAEHAMFTSDREYRDALKDNGGKIEHDMPKARELHLQRIRHMRVPQLEQLDRDWMRAAGQGKKSEAATLEAKRQRLRDLPQTLLPALTAANTIDDLKAI